MTPFFLFVAKNRCLKSDRSIVLPCHLRIVADLSHVKEVFGGNLNVVKSVRDIKWFETMENDWHDDAHKKCGCLHGRLDAVEVSEDFLDSKMKSKAKKMKVDPESVSLFSDVNDNCFKKQWLHVAAKDLHGENVNDKVQDVNKILGENMFLEIESEEEEKDWSAEEEEEEELVEGEFGKMKVIKRNCNAVKKAHFCEEWEFSSPMEVHAKKRKERGSMECEMHLTLKRPTTIRGSSPCKCTKMHHNDGNSKQTLAVAIEEGTHHCALSDETTNVEDDNNESKNIESGMQKSGNGEEIDLGIVDDVETGRKNHKRKAPFRLKDCQMQEQTLMW